MEIILGIAVALVLAFFAWLFITDLSDDDLSRCVNCSNLTYNGLLCGTCAAEIRVRRSKMVDVEPLGREVKLEAPKKL